MQFKEFSSTPTMEETGISQTLAGSPEGQATRLLCQLSAILYHQDKGTSAVLVYCNTYEEILYPSTTNTIK